MSAAAGDVDPVAIEAAAARQLVERWMGAAEALEAVRLAIADERDGDDVSVSCGREQWAALLSVATGSGA